MKRKTMRPNQRRGNNLTSEAEAVWLWSKVGKWELAGAGGKSLTQK